MPKKITDGVSRFTSVRKKVSADVLVADIRKKPSGSFYRNGEFAILLMNFSNVREVHFAHTFVRFSGTELPERINRHLPLLCSSYSLSSQLDEPGHIAPLFGFCFHFCFIISHPSAFPSANNFQYKDNGKNGDPRP